MFPPRALPLALCVRHPLPPTAFLALLLFAECYIRGNVKIPANSRAVTRGKLEIGIEIDGGDLLTGSMSDKERNWHARERERSSARAYSNGIRVK